MSRALTEGIYNAFFFFSSNKEPRLERQPHERGVVGSIPGSERPKCYGRPLLQAWLLPDLNTIPNNCVGENSV